MRLSCLTVLAVVLAPALNAQAVEKERVAQRGELEVDLHYSPANTWVSSNKPAYVALFDISRTQVRQVYPTFSAQAEFPVGADRRLIDVSTSPAIGGATFLSTSLVAPGGFGGFGYDGGWPHVLLLVASTAPLRVGSPWNTDIALNHELLVRHMVDVQSDAGIDALVDLIKPLDSSAEMSFDRVDGIPARQAQYAAMEGYHPGAFPGLGLNCSTPDFWLYQYQTDLGAALTPTCVMPVPQPATPRVTPPATPPKDTATTIPPASVRNAHRISESRKITDPAEIKRFVDAYGSRRSDPNGGSRPADGRSLNGESARALQHFGDGSADARSNAALTGEAVRAARSAPTPTPMPASAPTISAPASRSGPGKP